jgi:hypothetical protein
MFGVVWCCLLDRSKMPETEKHQIWQLIGIKIKSILQSKGNQPSSPVGSDPRISSLRITPQKIRG